MANITWPSDIKVGAVDYSIEFDVQLEVSRNGRITTFGLPGARWVATLRFEPDKEQYMRPKLEAMLVSLEGGANRLIMGHWGRPIPNGTLRGSPILGSPVAAGARTMTISNANGTVKRGDILGLPNQLVMVTADASPDIGQNMTVNFAPAARANYNSGTSVVWRNPTTSWIPRSNIAGPFGYAAGKFRPGFSVDFIEAG